VILAGALILRLGFLLLFGHTLTLQASGYDTYATNLLAGQGYTRFDDRPGDSDLPPLYGFFLAAIYATLGRSPIAVALVQTGLDLLTLTLIYLIGRRAFPSRSAPALLGAAFTAGYPYLIFQNLSTNDTALFGLLRAAGVWGAYRTADQPGLAWPLVIGLCYGLAALTKTLVVLMLPLLGLWWWRRIGFRQALTAAIAAGLALGLVILPWIARNTALHGELVLISTNDGSNLHQGNNPCAADYLAAGWDVQWVGGECYPPMPDGLGETGQSHWHRDQALAWLAAHSDQWLRHFGQKFLTLWTPSLTPSQVPPLEATSEAAFIDDAVYQYETPAFQLARTVHVIYFAPLLLLGVAGWILAARRGEAIGPLLAVLAAITITYLVFHPSTRYRMPAAPFLFLLSGYAVAQMIKRAFGS